MKLSLVLAFIVVALGFGFWLGQQTISPQGQAVSVDEGALQIFFCPEDDCDTQLISRLSGARESIDIAIYSFTLDEIADALIEKQRQGIPVRVVFDSGQAESQFSEDERLAEAGIAVKRLDLGRGIMHNKYVIIDNMLVGTGSYNYSQNASEFNRENLVFVSSPVTAQSFERNFDRLWNASE